MLNGKEERRDCRFLHFDRLDECISSNVIILCDCNEIFRYFGAHNSLPRR